MSQQSERLFTSPDAWSGGAYELAICLGPSSEDRLGAALEALWSHPGVDGCYEHADREPGEQKRIAAVTSGRDLQTVLRGRARVLADVLVPCSTLPVREADTRTWLYFGLPLGSMTRAYPVGAFPWDDGSDLAWREQADAWLRILAGHVFERVSYSLALVGFTDGLEEPEQVEHDGVPARRWVGYLVREGATLRWYPPTEGAPIRTNHPSR